MSAWLTLLLALAPQIAAAPRISYPESPVRDVPDTLHGRVLIDPYRWLEEDTTKAVQDWTAAQNALTRKVLDGFPGRALLEERLRNLYAIPVMSKPEVFGGRLFYSKRAGSQNQPLLLVRQTERQAAPRVVLDPNGLSADGTVALDWMFPSPDGSLIAYGTSASGSEKSTLKVRHVDSAEDLTERIEHTEFASVAWDPDAKGFLYTRHPARGQVPEGEEVFHERVYYHRLGDDPASDTLIFGGEGRPIQESRGVLTSSDRNWVFLETSLDWAKNDLYVRRSGSRDAFVPVAVGLDGNTHADAFGGRLYIRSNVHAPRYRILTADPAAPDSSNWKVLIPEQQGVIDEFAIVGGRIALAISEKAVSRLFLYGLDGSPIREVSLPTLGEVSDLAGEPGGKALYFVFTSFVYPAAVYRYDLERDTLEPLEKPTSDINASVFEAREDWVTSKDGTKVPIFVVHKKGVAMDGNRPTLLSGYGGFDISETPAFRPYVIPWLEAGGVYAQVCLRGGGEFGKEWHEAGRLERKQNVFDDFHAAAEWLVSTGITKPARLAGQGGSNGGLLVGAALTQRPELFGAIVCQVPLLDMIRYQRFSIARYWVPEYGSSEDTKQFEFLLAYSPYHNVKAGTRYPATLLTTAESDSRVAPLHARKMAALLQAKTGGDAPILLRVETKAGHGSGKPTSKRIAESVDILSFLMMRLGVSPGS
jgi:prolyl oligopeptidase